MSARVWILVVGVGAVAVGVCRAVMTRRGPVANTRADRWQTVTIGAPEQTVLPAQLPGPLTAISEWADIKAVPAPGGRGTELSARPKDGANAPDKPRPAIRIALRRTKQLLEVGEVIELHPKPGGRRPPTPGGLLVDAAATRAEGEGIL